MQNQGTGKSVVHNKPEYADVQYHDGNFTDIIHESLSYLQNCPVKTNKSESISQSIPEQREPDRMSENRERKPTSKGLLARVKCQQRNARTSAILSVFPKPRESVSLQNPAVAVSITSHSLPDFLNLSESCREKAAFVQRHNTSLHSKFRKTSLKLTPKGLDYTQIGTLREPYVYH